MNPLLNLFLLLFISTIVLIILDYQQDIEIEQLNNELELRDKELEKHYQFQWKINQDLDKRIIALENKP